MSLLDEINHYGPVLTLALTIITSALLGSKIVIKFFQKRNLAILNNKIDVRINTCMSEITKETKNRLDRHSKRIGSLETRVSDIWDLVTGKK
jgi:hypothetical protein